MSHRALRRVGATGLAAVVAVGVLTGCGGNQYTAYCDQVTEHQTEVADALSRGPRTGLLAALPAFRDISANAPSDIAPQWAVVIEQITGLQQALDDAGVAAADYDPAKPPAGLTTAQRDAIESAAADLLSPDSVTAFSTVQQQVRDVCHTPLSS